MMVSTTTAPRTVDGTATESVVVSMTIDSVSYDALMSEAALLEGFIVALQEAIAAAFDGVAPSDVTILLTAGSVRAESRITPPASGAVTASSVSEVLKSPGAVETLASSVVQEVSALPGISRVATGNITVSRISEPQVVSSGQESRETFNEYASRACSCAPSAGLVAIVFFAAMAATGDDRR